LGRSRQPTEAESDVLENAVTYGGARGIGYAIVHVSWMKARG
jgi:hypothetical protein